MPTVASVLIDGATDDLVFDYLLPEAIAAAAAVGCRVRVPLRNRKAIGTVVRVGEPPEDVDFSRLKPVDALIDADPILTPPLLELAGWMTDYYLAPRETALRAMIPQAARGEKKAEKTQKAVFLKAPPDEPEMEALQRRAPRQADIIAHLRLQPGQQGLLADLTGSSGFNRASISALEKAGFVEVRDQLMERDPYANETFLESRALTLNPEQQIAFEAICAATEAGNPRPFLLHGVTGSGKTEIYLQAIQRALDLGKGAIVLVPEISLTPQTAGRFKKRFAAIQDQVAILHSHLSPGERHDEWRKVLRRQARIVIGARSAIFAPVDNLGLIVVDEEHENSYKQESPPRYHARDLAVVRGQIEKCAVVLGSATPALESYQNAQTEKYGLLTLEKRVDEQVLPLIRVIDMRIEARKHRGGPAILSEKLRQAIDSRLALDQQVILFLNRRGFARSLMCPECGFVAECRHCSLALTYHQEEEKLLCHLCGFSQVSPRRCPECGTRAISLAGYGTEKVEQVIRKVFATARVARVDTDVMRKKNQLRDILTAFKTHKIDILLGTQMIAKGLHFPNVTLVGILNADIGLHIPDFRASERTFQLLTQVSGRAGRGKLEGEVIVQTFTPHAPAIQFARHHDYIGFARQELELRRAFRFPPFLHMAMITVRSVHQQRAEFTLKTLHRRLARDLPEGVEINEPGASPLVKSHDQWRFQTSMRSPAARRLANHIRGVLKDMTFPEDVVVTVDMDPYNLS